MEGVNNLTIPIALLTLVLACARSSAQIIGACPEEAPRKPVAVKRVRGIVMDTSWAVIPKLQVHLQREEQHAFRDYRASTTDSNGRFDFGRIPERRYRLLTKGDKPYAGFCEQSLPIEVTKRGWTAFSMRLPPRATDSCPGQCQAIVEELHE